MTKKSNLYKATFEQVLFFADEPQLVLFSSLADTKVVAVAINKWDNYENPFFAAHVSSEQFNDYLNEKFDLRYLLLKPDKKKHFVFDFNAIENNVVSLKKIELDRDKQKDLLPDSGLFSRDHTEEYKRPSKRKQAMQKFLVDGSWDLPEFSHFYRQVTDLYALFSNIDIYTDKGTPVDTKDVITDAFINPFKGGGSYSSLYKSLVGSLANDNRLHVSGITYNSPGHINLRGSTKSFKDISSLLSNFDDNSSLLKEKYKALDKTLGDNKLRALSADKFEESSDLAKLVVSQSKDLADILNVIEYKQLLKMAGSKKLIAAKVLLSIYRRAEKLQEYFLEGRVSFEK